MSALRCLAPLLLVACAIAAPASDPVLATFTGGKVTASDIDAEVAMLAAGEVRFRKEAGFSDARNTRDYITRSALRVIARLATENEGPIPADLREAVRKNQRDWLLSRWERECYGRPPALPDEEALRREAASHAIQLPQRLRLSHIFQRAGSEAEVAAARTRLQQWRTEATSIERFRELARAHSDSDSARQGGSLGWIRPGWLPAQAEERLRKLAAGSVSEPLELRGGLHIFFVEANDPPHALPLDRQIVRLRAQKLVAARGRCRDEVLAALTASSLRKGEALQASTPVGERIVAGEWTTTRGAIDRVFGDAAGEEGFLQRYREDELLFQDALRKRALPPADMAYLDALAGDSMLLAIIERRAQSAFSPPSRDALLARYEAQGERGLRRPRQLGLHVLKATFPEKQDPLAFHDELAQLARQLEAKEERWEEVASRVPGASVESWALKDELDLAGQLGPDVVDRIRQLAPGEVSSPIKDGGDLYVIGVREVSPARRLSFEEALPRLKRAYLAEANAKLTEQITSELIVGAGFLLTPEGRARTAEAR